MSDEMQMSTIEDTSTTVDNSTESYTEEQISDAFDQLDQEPTEEVETTDNEGQGEQPTQEAKSEVQIDKRFLDKDGNVNTENLYKSYRELEPLINQKSQWEKEKAELLEKANKYDEIQKQQDEVARQKGYESNEDLEFNKDLALREAQEYYKYIGETDDPENVTRLLERYADTADESLLDDIMAEFPPRTSAKISALKERVKLNREAEKMQLERQAQYQELDNLISESVDQHGELLNHAPFRKLFENAIRKYGKNFTKEDADALAEMVTGMKELFAQEFASAREVQKQNQDATDKIANIQPASAQDFSKVDISTLSQGDLEKVIAKFI